MRVRLLHLNPEHRSSLQRKHGYGVEIYLHMISSLLQLRLTLCAVVASQLSLVS